MREAAVMGKSKDRAFEAVEHVQIGRLRGQSHSRGRKGRLAVESRSRQTRTGQEMCDGLQVDFVTQTVPGSPGRPRSGVEKTRASALYGLRATPDGFSEPAR